MRNADAIARPVDNERTASATGRGAASASQTAHSYRPREGADVGGGDELSGSSFCLASQTLPAAIGSADEARDLRADSVRGAADSAGFGLRTFPLTASSAKCAAAAVAAAAAGARHAELQLTSPSLPECDLEAEAQETVASPSHSPTSAAAAAVAAARITAVPARSRRLGFT